MTAHLAIGKIQKHFIPAFITQYEQICYPFTHRVAWLGRPGTYKMWHLITLGSEQTASGPEMDADGLISLTDQMHTLLPSPMESVNVDLQGAIRT